MLSRRWLDSDKFGKFSVFAKEETLPCIFTKLQVFLQCIKALADIQSLFAPLPG